MIRAATTFFAVLALGVAAGWLVLAELAGLPSTLREISWVADLGGAPTEPPAASPSAPPADRLAWQASHAAEAAERADLWARAVEARPDDAAFAAERFVAALDAALADAEAHEAGLRTALEEGRRIEPANGLYDLGWGIFLLHTAYDLEGEEPALRDAARADDGIDHLVAAAGATRLRLHYDETAPLELARRAGLEDVDFVREIGIAASTLLPIVSHFKKALDLAGRRAAEVHASGEVERAHRAWEAGTTLAVAYQHDARWLIEVLVGLAVEKKIRKQRIEAWTTEGAAEAVDREWRVLVALREAQTEARSLGEGTEVSRFGVLDRLLLPVGGLDETDPGLGRRWEYRGLALAGIALAAIVLLVATAVLAARWAVHGGRPSFAAGDLAAAVGGGVLAPVALFLLLDRFHPTRAAGLASQPDLLFQPIALALLVPTALVLLAARLTGEPLGRLGRGAAVLLGLSAFVSFFWTGSAEAGPWFSHAAYAAAGLAALGTLASMAAILRWTVAGPASAGRDRLGAVAAGAGFLLVLLVAATIALPAFRAAGERYAGQVIRPRLVDEVEASRWHRVADLDRQAAASDED